MLPELAESVHGAVMMNGHGNMPHFLQQVVVISKYSNRAVVLCCIYTIVKFGTHRATTHVDNDVPTSKQIPRRHKFVTDLLDWCQSTKTDQHQIDLLWSRIITNLVLPRSVLTLPTRHQFKPSSDRQGCRLILCVIQVKMLLGMLNSCRQLGGARWL